MRCREAMLVGALGLVCVRETAAQPVPDPDPDAEPAPPPPPSALPRIQIHGFASEGGFVSTANDYIGRSSRGSVELFEAAINFSTEIGDRLRVGLQLFAANVGTLSDGTPRVDWAFLDYRWKPWIGMRAGIIKIPNGLYNEFVDIDSARVPILMPQAVYPIRNRDVLISHTGFSLYGTRALGAAGEVDYEAWLGTLSIPRSALELVGATLDEVDTKYVTGGQVFWRPPVTGLRVGASAVRASINFNLTLTPDSVMALIAAGVVPAEFDGKLVVSQRPTTFYVGSVEYTRGNWLVAAEYSRARKRQRTSLPAVIPTFIEESERFYAMVNRQFTPAVSGSVYYSVSHADVDHRTGRDPKFPERFFAFQRDAAATLRFDVNDNWLWKLEAHLIDGVADLSASANPEPERVWGLFLFKTTVTF